MQFIETSGSTTHTLLPMVHVLEHFASSFESLSTNPKGSVGKARRWLKGQLVSCASKVSQSIPLIISITLKKPSCIRVDDLIDKGRQGIQIFHLAQRPTSQTSFAKQQFYQTHRVRYEDYFWRVSPPSLLKFIVLLHLISWGGLFNRFLLDHCLKGRD